jgi:hypothetical protein
MLVKGIFPTHLKFGTDTGTFDFNVTATVNPTQSAIKKF